MVVGGLPDRFSVCLFVYISLLGDVSTLGNWLSAAAAEHQLSQNNNNKHTAEDLFKRLMVQVNFRFSGDCHEDDSKCHAK